MAGRLKAQPRPNSLLPLPELYCSDSEGVKPLRPGVSGKATCRDAVPFTAFTVNFSSMPFRAPPPLGRLMDGAADL